MIDSVNPEAGGAPADLRKPKRRKLATDARALTPVDRLPPHSIEAEQCVLSCVMQSPNDCTGKCIEKFKAGSAVFYDLKHQVIYDALLEMYEAKQAIDVITLHQRLKDKQQLEGVGGLEYIASLPDKVASSANLEFYQGIVWDKYILRKVISTCTDIVGQVYENEGEVDALVDTVETQILRIAEERESSRTQTLLIKDVVHKAINRLEEYHANQGMLTGIGTGFPDLDKMTTGLHGGEMIVIAARPSMGKCLAADSELVLRDGSVATIEEIYQRRAAELLTLKADWKFAFTQPSDFVDDGRKPVFRVRTRLGREIETTWTHPLLTVDGWRPLGELRVGMRVAVPRSLPVFGRERVGEGRVTLLAYLLGDGCLTHSSATFTNTNARIREDFAGAAREFGGVALREFDSNGTRATSLRVVRDDLAGTRRRAFGVALKSAISSRRLSARKVALAIGASPVSVCEWQKGNCVPDERYWMRLCRYLEVDEAALMPDGIHATAQNRLNGLTAWLEDLGLRHCDAHTKFIPAFIFRLERPLVALFLNRLFATDGWATTYRTGQAQVGFSSVSERLIRQVQHLLLRFGIVASLRRRMVKYEDGRRPAFQLEITDNESLRTFVEEIGIFGKEEAVARISRGLAARRRQTNVDLIPREIWRRLETAKGAESWASLARRAGVDGWTNIHVGQRSLSRARLRKFADALGDRELQQLATSDVFWDRIVSIEPLGRKQVYDLTIPGTHNFVANDVCVHNTSLAMNMAEAVALDQKLPVGVFSLEMSAESLVLRMLCSRARVNLRNIREGFFSERDFPKITSAAGKLAAAPLYIDDTAGLSILQLRAKARRMWQQYGIKLFIIDYLQLVHSTARRAENRQQEIADISNGVKGLAKELDVPVIVLSQLNRELEKDKNRKPRMSDLRECVTGDTLVCLADGRRVPIEKLVGQTPRVLAISEEGKIISARSDKVWEVGVRETVVIRLASGRSIQVTPQHRLMTAEGWKRATDIGAGARLAIARRLPRPTRPETWPDSQVMLLGQLIGDGSYLVHQPLRYTTASEENSAAVANAARAEFRCDVKRYAGRGKWHQLLISGNGNRWAPAGVNQWLRGLGIHGQRSHEKRVPESVFRLSNEQVALFLRHLWATDGCISVRKQSAAGAPAVFFATNSSGLAHDVAALLLRFEIVARIRAVPDPRYRPVFTVNVSGTAEQQRFLERIGAFGPRTGPAQRLTAVLANKAANTNVDTLPRETFMRVRELMRQQGISHRQMAARRGTSYGGTAHFQFAPSRTVVAQYADILKDAQLKALTQNDLFWDEVVAIENGGRQRVFDLTVPGPTCWLADGVVSHNSGAIEQDADLIGLLYKPAAGDDDEGPSNEQEAVPVNLLIAKQRNGPTGDVNLTFLKTYTRFESAAKISADDIPVE